MSNILREPVGENPGETEPLIWLDAEPFASRVLLNGKPFPWTQPTELVNTYGQMQKLLAPDIAPVNIGNFLNMWLAENRGVLSEMRGKKRIRFALKKLLAMEEPRAILRDIVSALCQTLSEPLVLVFPANGDLINWANRMANAVEPAEIDEMDIDSVSVYLADYLRTFNGLKLGGIVVKLSPATAVTDEHLELYSPIRNVAKHYQWDFCIQVDDPTGIDCSKDSVDVIISNHRMANIRTLADAFWETALLPKSADIRSYYAEVPSHLTPDVLLERIGMLKQNCVQAN